MMNLIVNGEPRAFEKLPSLAELITALGYEGDFFAVALNRACVPRWQYDATVLKNGDEIEILSPMQGG